MVAALKRPVRPEEMQLHGCWEKSMRGKMRGEGSGAMAMRVEEGQPWWLHSNDL